MSVLWLGHSCIRRKGLDTGMHIAGGGFRAGVAHQVAQHQQIDARGGELGAVGVPQPVRPNPRGAGQISVGAEDPPQGSLAHRLSAGRAAQHDETLRSRTTRRALLAQVTVELGKEVAVDWDDPFLPALADHPDPLQTKIDIGQPQRPDLS